MAKEFLPFPLSLICDENYWQILTVPLSWSTLTKKWDKVV